MKTKSAIKLTVTMLTLTMLIGCGKDNAKPAPVMQAEAQGQNSVQGELEITPRPWPEMTLEYRNMGTEHTQLYLANPYEAADEQDGYFQAGSDDLWAAVTAPAEFIIDTVLLPVSAVAHPPWKSQSSRDSQSVQPAVFDFQPEPSNVASKEEY